MQLFEDLQEVPLDGVPESLVKENREAVRSRSLLRRRLEHRTLNFLLRERSLKILQIVMTSRIESVEVETQARPRFRAQLFVEEVEKVRRNGIAVRQNNRTRHQLRDVVFGIARARSEVEEACIGIPRSEPMDPRSLLPLDFFLKTQFIKS